MGGQTERGGENLRGGVEADDVSDCVWVGRDAPAEGEAFVIGLGDEGAALVVFFVPWLWRRGEGEGEEGEEGEEGQGVGEHLFLVVVLVVGYQEDAGCSHTRW